MDWPGFETDWPGFESDWPGLVFFGRGRGLAQADSGLAQADLGLAQAELKKPSQSSPRRTRPGAVASRIGPEALHGCRKAQFVMCFVAVSGSR